MVPEFLYMYMYIMTTMNFWNYQLDTRECMYVCELHIVIIQKYLYMYLYVHSTVLRPVLKQFL